MAKHNRTGEWGEDIAAEWLIAKGYSIIERNWHLGHLEIDIVAMKDDRLIFVEVKTRENTDIDPVSAVDRRKIMRVVRAANAYIAASALPHEPQFDIIAISGPPAAHTLAHIPDAFRPPRQVD